VKRSTLSERALIVAPRGRDAAVAASILEQANLEAEPCASIPDLLSKLDTGSAFVIATEEAFAMSDLRPLAAWLNDQEEWSDLPFVLLTGSGGGLERNPSAKRYLDVLGNVTFLERPFHPTTLVSLARSALRGRLKQYEARARLAELAESEARFRNMADHAPVMTWVTDPTGACTYLNRRWYEFTGQTRKQAEGFGWLQAVHPEDRGWSGEAFLAANVRREAFQLEFRLRRHDGSYRWAIDAASPRFGQTDEFLGYVGSVFDIDERREMEERLRVGEERLRLATEAAAVGTWDFDPVTGTLSWDERCKALFGLSPNVTVDYNTFLAGLHPEDRAASDAAVKQALASEGTPDFSIEYRTIGLGDGIERWIAARGRAFFEGFEGNRRARRFVGTAIDITSAKRAEEILEDRVEEALAQRKLLADIVEGTDAFVQVVDLNFRWLAINRAAAEEFERIFGIRPTVGQSMLEVLASYPDRQKSVRELWSRALAGDEFTEVRAFSEPGRTRRHYELKFNVLRNQEGRRIGAYQFAYDVTQRIEEQLRLAQAEESLRQAQKMEAVGQLTGGVAHDFNNLLTIIKSSTDLLRRPDIPEDRRRRYVDAISDTVDRASKLTSQLLAFARRQSLKPEIFDVADRILFITEMLRTIVGSRIQIVTNASDELCLVMADVNQFETALVNLAVNARDAMGGEGTMTVQVHTASRVPPIRNHQDRDGEFVCIALTDTGSGIEADKLNHIFEPFYTTKEVGKGTGLGLSQVFGFVKQSGGDVSVVSEVGRGSTFTLYLPRIADHGAHDSESQNAPASSAEENGRGRRVLVVEDNIEVGRFSTQILRDLGYEPTLALNADEALKLLTEGNDFEVVFSDVVMPGMSGLELGQEIRRRHPGLPVVLTSGYSHVLAEEGRHGFELLKKPYAAADLSRMLRKMTRALEAASDQGLPNP
jgi:PAS domain S-box-containing protein